MNYLSLCSGIEAATQAWHPLGWTAEAFSEIEAFPSAVLAHHYPDTPNLGDMTQYEQWNINPIDLLVGGTPCQSFSVAGLRKGLADPRGNLMLTYLAIAARFKPRWIVWENVPGVLSSNGGRDFATFLGGLAQCGYGFAYRVLDAQYVRTCRHPGAVPQRRRRVFVVGYFGDWRRAAAVLFDRESLRGNPPPRREAGKGTAGFTQSSIGGYREGCGTLRANGGDNGGGSENLAVMATGQAGAEITKCHAPTLNCNHEAPIAFERRFVRTTGGQPQAGVNGCLRADTNTGDGAPCVAIHGTQDPCTSEHAAFALGRNSGQENALCRHMQVRRLTPEECEALQGFPRGFTRIPWKSGFYWGNEDMPPEAIQACADQCPDGPRYKALGNSMAVNCMDWIGQRINHIESIKL